MIHQYNQLGSRGFIGEICDLFTLLTNYCTRNKWVSVAVINYTEAKNFSRILTKNTKRKLYWPSKRDVVFLVDEIPLYQQQVFLHRKLKEIKTQLNGILQRLSFRDDNEMYEKACKVVVLLIYTYCFFKVRTTSDKQNLRTFQGQIIGLRFSQ